MRQSVPLKKRSKRAQREYHAGQRGSWCGVNSVTRAVPSGKAYDRKHGKRESRVAASQGGLLHGWPQ